MQPSKSHVGRGYIHIFSQEKRWSGFDHFREMLMSFALNTEKKKIDRKTPKISHSKISISNKSLNKFLKIVLCGVLLIKYIQQYKTYQQTNWLSFHKWSLANTRINFN